MSRFVPDRDTAPVLDAGAEWIRRCLIGQGSLFADRPMWTPQLIDELRRGFTDSPIDSTATVFEKLEGEVADASPVANGTCS